MTPSRTTTIETALGFVLAHPDVHTAIVGTRNPAHMQSNIELVERQVPSSPKNWLKSFTADTMRLAPTGAA